MRSEDYRRIEQAMGYMEAHDLEQPSLEEMAASVNLSKYHFQRLFTQWAGISPGRFLHCLTLHHAKRLLGAQQSVLDTSLDAGLSGPGRLHDLFVTYEAVTPGEYKRGGAGLSIAYGFHATPFGECLLGATGRGICALTFVRGGDREGALAELRARWPRATLGEAPERTGPLAERAFGGQGADRPALHLVLHGTNFQVKVWEALLRIPPGTVATYGAVAAAIGRPTARQAVGQATGRNPIAVLIPCHRVIRRMGVVGGYRWGAPRKRMLLAWEAARAAPQGEVAAGA